MESRKMNFSLYFGEEACNPSLSSTVLEIDTAEVITISPHNSPTSTGCVMFRSVDYDGKT